MFGAPDSGKPRPPKSLKLSPLDGWVLPFRA